MDKNVATSLLNAALSLNEKLGEMDLIVSSITDLDTKKKYAKALGDIIGGITFDIILPIVNEYPDLEPYR